MIEVVKWNKQHLRELVRKIGLRRTPGQGKTPIHLSLYVADWAPEPLLTQVIRLDAAAWSVLGYDETDRVSAVQYLGSLKCRTEGALQVAVRWQHPLTPELAKALIDAGAFNKDALSQAAYYQRPLTLELAKTLIDAGTFDEEALSDVAWGQRPLTLELAKALIDAGCNPTAQDGDGWDALVWLAVGGYPADPQVTDLFLSAGCRMDLDGCEAISERTRFRFDQILKEHAEWKLGRECVATSTSYGPDWGR